MRMGDQSKNKREKRKEKITFPENKRTFERLMFHTSSFKRDQISDGTTAPCLWKKFLRSNAK